MTRPTSTSTSTLALALATTFTVTGCAPAGPSVRRSDASLTVACAVPGARVYLDDTFVGRASELSSRALRVPSGTRRVEVRADGYFTTYREVAVPPNGAARVEVPLRRVPDNEPGG